MLRHGIFGGADEAGVEVVECAVMRLDVLRSVEADARSRMAAARVQWLQAAEELVRAEQSTAAQEEDAARAQQALREDAERRALMSTTAARRLRWSAAGRRKLRAAHTSLAGAGDVRTGCADQIDKDTERTFAALEGMADGGWDTAPVRLGAVLRAATARMAELNLAPTYVQGMNFRAAAPVLLLEEEEAYGLTCLLLEDCSHTGFWAASPPFVGMIAARMQLEEEVARRLPRLAAALGDQLGSLTSLLAPMWLIPLFVGALPWPVAAAAIDDVVEAAHATASSPRGAGAATAVQLWWCVGLLAHFEGAILRAMRQEAEGQDTVAATTAFRVIRELAEALPPDFRPRSCGKWDTAALRRRHGELLLRLTSEFEAARLRPSTKLTPEQIRALRQEFDHLCHPHGFAKLEVSLAHGTLDQGGVLFDAGTQVVLAVCRGAVTGGSELTGWRLRAVDGCAVAAASDLSAVGWRDWPLVRWYHRRPPESPPRLRRRSSVQIFAKSPTRARGEVDPDWVPFETEEAVMFEELVSSAQLEMRRLSLHASHPTMYTIDIARMRATHQGTGAVYELLRTEGRIDTESKSDSVFFFEGGGAAVVHETEVRHLRMWSQKGLPRGVSKGDAAQRAAVPPPAACCWEGDWKLDRSVGGDQDGWLYANGVGGPFRAGTDGGKARRRQWTRVYRPCCLPQAAADDGELSPTAEGADEGIGIEALGGVIARVVPAFPAECLAGLFKLLDVRGRGRVDFFRLIIGLAILGAGSAEKKLRLLFDLHDLDGTGQLAKDELGRLVASMCDVAQTPGSVLVADAPGAAVALLSARGGALVCEVPDGSPVTVLRSAADWVRVQLRVGDAHRVGWVAAEQLGTSDPPIVNETARLATCRLLALGGNRTRMSAAHWVQYAPQQPAFWLAVSAAGIDMDFTARGGSVDIHTLHTAFSSRAPGEADESDGVAG
eukprot:TRINITY_DN28784_c0_g1_i2.p1 TRINITY_DN28784_c0_g1~~TRINITY_DN28784_c0_g1_i2.p1  ORF type:complete len:966 (+),score=391.71 TRINITY_DN28784_c0_g1_i2:59-2899(+)